MHLSICPSIHLFFSLSIYLSLCLSVRLSVYLSIDPSIHLSTYLSTHRRIYLSAGLSIFLTIHRSKLFRKTFSNFGCPKLENQHVVQDFLHYCTLEPWKRRNSARLPHILEVGSSKTTIFCETAFRFWYVKENLILTSTSSCSFWLACLQKTAPATKKVQLRQRKPCTCHEKWCPQKMIFCNTEAARLPQVWRLGAPTSWAKRRKCCACHVKCTMSNPLQYLRLLYITFSHFPKEPQIQPTL